MKKKKTAIQPVDTGKKSPSIAQASFSWSRFSFKLFALFVIVLLVVVYTDRKGYFISDQSNNHIARKWTSFYKFTKTKKVDVIILGNSHIVTGIDPFILSVATGSNCFILANSGTSVVDAYFHLEEALKYTAPKLVILETYCIGNTEKAKVESSVIPQIQSFEAHRNIPHKLQMMPKLLYSDCWVKAWSPTIRNHSFLLTNRDILKYNKENPNPPLPRRLDLGRFARFESGLEDSTIEKYNQLGAPVQGNDYEVSKHSQKYVKKIMSLCASKNIPVLLLTVPMYYRHIDNYEVWKTALGKVLEQYPSAQWLDLQLPYDSALFTEEAFENTYEANQHLSNYGMGIVAYKVANFLSENDYKLPDRSKENSWIADFKNQPHYIFNQKAPPNSEYLSILSDKSVGGFRVNEMLLQGGNEANRLIVKIDNTTPLPPSIEASFIIQHGGNTFPAPMRLYRFRDVFPPHHSVYAVDIRKDITVLDIAEIR